jgi:hypothetical protein
MCHPVESPTPLGVDNKEHRMRFATAVLVAVTSVLTVASPAHAGHPSLTDPAHDQAHDWAFVQHELFDVSLDQFARDARHGDRWFDWSNDGCSAPLLGNRGTSYDFQRACVRHDFGYRNLHRLERRYGTGHTFWNAVNRRRADQQFLADMKHHCRTRIFWRQPACFVYAYTYYAAVRAVAGP